MKVYILLPEGLNQGQYCAQAAHAMGKLSVRLRVERVWERPVVCLIYKSEEDLEIPRHIIPEHVTWEEPDYGFPCVSVAFMTTDDTPFMNQMFGKLQMV